MSFFVLFVLSAVLIGAGAMLAPVFATAQPRVGLASTVALAFVMSGGILWTRFIGWDTLVIDYLLFGLVSLVVLGGTMVQAHQKATGDDTIEPKITWMSRNDFLFLLILSLFCLIPLFSPMPLENDFMIATGQTLPEIKTAYPQINQSGATGFYILSVYLSAQLRQNIELVYPAVLSVLMILTVLMAYDSGAEIRNTLTGRFFAVGMLIVLIIAYFLLPDLLPATMSLLFLLASLIFALRAIRYHEWRDIVNMVLLLLSFLLVS